MKITGNYEKDLECVKEILDSDDVNYYEFKIAERRATVVYVDSISDKEGLGKLVIRPLTNFKGNFTTEEMAAAIEVANTKTGLEVDDMIADILSGDPGFIVEGVEGYFTCDLKKFEVRAVTEPPLQTVIKGPREGFNECIKTNLSLLRRRMKTNSLKIKNLTIGKISQTAISVVYLKDIADEKLVADVIEKLENIEIDSVVDSSYLAKLICSNGASIFKQINTAEKPDVVTARLTEGRVAILVDGSPIVLTVPYLLIEDFQNPEDYYGTTTRAMLTRWVRVVAVIIAVLLPAIYVASQLFHLQFIPLNFLLTIINSIKGIPMSPSFEMFFTLIIFEILNEASIRMPKYVGMALSVVGAIVLGETAVHAGIVSSPAILIMALSAISLYTVPELVETLSLVRITLLIVAGAMGGYGAILTINFIIIYLCGLENFGVPVLAPFAPLITKDLKDTLYLGYLQEMEYRPETFSPKNKRRLRNEKKN